MAGFNFNQGAGGPKPYNPADYGLPVWRDEDHQPPPETVTAEQEPQAQTVDGMSIEAAKNKLCAWALSQVGYHEEANNWNKYANMAAVQRLYGGSIQNAPWCDLFTDAAFVTVFGLERGAAMTYQTVGNGSALCRTSAEYFQERGAWISRGQTPDPGDVVFFYVNGDINHQGIVVRVVGGSVVTVEGNSSDMVAEHVYSVSDTSIAGYGRPRWELAAGAEDNNVSGNDATDIDAVGKPAKTCTPTLPVLRPGDIGPAVAALQMALRYRRYDPRWVDGEFGPRTEQQLKAFQKAAGLVPDGVCGEKTYSALFEG